MELHCFDSFILDYKILVNKLNEYEGKPVVDNEMPGITRYKKTPCITNVLNMECYGKKTISISKKAFNSVGVMGKSDLLQILERIISETSISIHYFDGEICLPKFLKA